MWACGVLFSAACGGGSNAAPGDASADDGSAQDGGNGDASGTSCPPEGARCEGTRYVPCDGRGAPAVDCADSGESCDARIGCTECVPGAQTCEGDSATWCRPDGTLVRFECDEVQGMQCQGDACTGECAPATVVDSYIGCDYYPTVTLNPVWSGFDFAVAVSNAATSETHVTISQGDALVSEADLAAGELRIFPLPWVSELKGGDVDACQQPPDAGDTRIVRDGAYRVRSDQPVTVYQFSPLEYQLDPAPAGCPVNADCPGAPDNAISDCLAYSNDASLLLPATALTGNYTVLSWPSWSQGSGFATVTAVEDDTEVRLVGDLAELAGGGLGSTGQDRVRLDQGDVLEVIAAAHTGAGYGADLSGMRIRADKPVQVVGGHSCAQVPEADTGTCDHLEQALVPEDTLGQRYVATLPEYLGSDESSPYVLRIVAIEPDTALTLTPAVSDVTTLSPDDGPLTVWLEGDDLGDVLIEADKPVLVGQYLPGQDALPGAGVAGDPSMSLLPPVEQFRSEYLFTAPLSFIASFANVIAPTGSRVEIDGRSVDPASFEALGDSGLGVARVLLDDTSEVHALSADAEVGLVVYGYGLFTSYMYPGGMDLERITVPPLF